MRESYGSAVIDGKQLAKRTVRRCKSTSSHNGIEETSCSLQGVLAGWFSTTTPTCPAPCVHQKPAQTKVRTVALSAAVRPALRSPVSAGDMA
jgi:hypothetical protein